MEKKQDVVLSAEEYSKLTDELSELREQVAWLKKQVFGQKSEKTETVLPNSTQIPLFDEAEVEAKPNAAREITVLPKQYSKPC